MSGGAHFDHPPYPQDIGTAIKQKGGLLTDMEEMTILEITEEYGFPIIANTDIGHDITTMPIPEGILAQIDAEALSIELIEPIVK